MSAVHDEFCARHIRRGRRSQEECDLGDLLALRRSPHWDSGDDRSQRAVLAECENRCRRGGVHESGHDGVDPNTVSGSFDRELPAEPEHARLGGRVSNRGKVDNAAQCNVRGGVDDGCTRTCEVRPSGPAHEVDEVEFVANCVMPVVDV